MPKFWIVEGHAFRLVWSACLSFIFMLCAGCQTSTSDMPPADAHTTVKHTLLEVKNAILLSCDIIQHETAKTAGSTKVSMETNDNPEISYTLTLTAEHLVGWEYSTKTTTTIHAMNVGSDETSIAVRCVSETRYLWPIPVTRHRSIERHILATIMKTLNKKSVVEPIH